jgi:hypothetical protein
VSLPGSAPPPKARVRMVGRKDCGCCFLWAMCWPGVSVVSRSLASRTVTESPYLLPILAQHGSMKIPQLLERWIDDLKEAAEPRRSPELFLLLYLGHVDVVQAGIAELGDLQSPQALITNNRDFCMTMRPHLRGVHGSLFLQGHVDQPLGVEMRGSLRLDVGDALLQVLALGHTRFDFPAEPDWVTSMILLAGSGFARAQECLLETFIQIQWQPKECCPAAKATAETWLMCLT